MVVSTHGAISPAAQAVEENTGAFLMALGAAGGGEQRRDGCVTWTIGGSPIDYHNAVVAADLPADQANQVIDESLALMRSFAIPGTWHVGPSMRPADLGARLLAAGFSYGGDEPGMALDLAHLPESAPAPTQLVITRVQDEQSLAAWQQTLASGFGEGEREAAWVAAMYRTLGLGDESGLRHYLAALDGRPVATASLYLYRQSAGIYFVFTDAQYRRRGIGAAITHAALVEGRRLGARRGVLGASDAGYAVYQRLGFEECCRIQLYEWRPDDPYSGGQ